MELPWWLKRQRICLKCGRSGFSPRIRRISCRREWQPTPVFLPGEFHGQRSLVGYSPWDHKKSDTTKRLTHTHTHTHTTLLGSWPRLAILCIFLSLLFKSNSLAYSITLKSDFAGSWLSSKSLSLFHKPSLFSIHPSLSTV